MSTATRAPCRQPGSWVAFGCSPPARAGRLAPLCQAASVPLWVPVAGFLSWWALGAACWGSPLSAQWRCGGDRALIPEGPSVVGFNRFFFSLAACSAVPGPRVHRIPPACGLGEGRSNRNVQVGLGGGRSCFAHGAGAQEACRCSHARAQLEGQVHLGRLGVCVRAFAEAEGAGCVLGHAEPGSCHLPGALGALPTGQAAFWELPSSSPALAGKGEGGTAHLVPRETWSLCVPAPVGGGGWNWSQLREQPGLVRAHPGFPAGV